MQIMVILLECIVDMFIIMELILTFHVHMNLMFVNVCANNE